MAKHLTLQQMADQHGVDTSALRHAIRRGRLKAHRADTGRGWLVDPVEARRYMRRVAGVPDGFVTAAEAARMMGRSRQRVHQMIAAGTLPARRSRDGRVFVPVDAVGGTDGQGDTDRAGRDPDGSVPDAGGGAGGGAAP